MQSIARYLPFHIILCNSVISVFHAQSGLALIGIMNDVSFVRGLFLNVTLNC